MKSVGQTKPLNKTILSSSISTALAVGIGLGVVTELHADTYEFSYSGLFTMLDPGGVVLQNTSYPYYGDPTWGYGLRSQISGTLSFDTGTGAGSGTVQPFEFFNKGPATASGVVFQSTGGGSLMIGNMNFNWNSSDIVTQVVLDGAGLFAAISSGDATTVSTTFDLASCAVGGGGSLDGLCALPASDGVNKGKIPIGPVPVATSSFNTIGQSGVGTVLADLSLGTDDGIGGSPMDNGPFSGFNANFDITSVTVTSFTDTTEPILTLNDHVSPPGTSVVTLVVGVDSYTEPGATCVDADPVGGSISVGAPTGGDVVNGPVDNSFIHDVVLTYTCTDTSSNVTQVDRTVTVVGPNAVITLSANAALEVDPVTQECGVAYTDAGAVCNDDPDGPILESGNGTDPGTFALDISGVDASVVSVGTATWTCTDSDSNTNIVDRTVNVVDTLAPVITIPANPYELVSSTLENPQTFVDPGDAVVNDTCDGGPIALPTATSGTVNMVVADTGDSTVANLLTYSWTDGEGNLGSTVRTVNVTRSQPVISLSDGMGGLGGGVVIDVGGTYLEQGMDIIDEQDLQGSSINVTSPGTSSGLTYTIDSSSVDTSVAGGYEVLYNVTDSDGNLATQVIRNVQVGVFATGSNFTMLDSSGSVIGGTNDVVFDWDESLNTAVTDLNFNMQISSLAPWPFNGFVWTAHSTRAFGPGTYSFDTGCTVAEIQATGCPAGSAANSGPTITMTVGEGQVGAHILFDWNTTTNIDVVNVWEVDGVWDRLGGTGPKNKLYDGLAGENPDPETTWKLVSIDVDGDGINGAPMLDGPFQGFNANFNAGPGASIPPPEPYSRTAPDTKLGDGLTLNIWGLFAGLVTLLGFRRFGKK